MKSQIVISPNNEMVGENLKSQFVISSYGRKREVTIEQMTEIMTVENIQNQVYIIRGQQVMLDYDLAEIYGYEVKRLNEQVKRNIARFPDDFMFQLTKDEIDFVKSQIATLKKGLLMSKEKVEVCEKWKRRATGNEEAIIK